MKCLIVINCALILLIPNVGWGACQVYSYCDGNCVNAGLPTLALEEGCLNNTWDYKYIGVSESSVSGPLYSIPTCPQCETGYKQVTQEVMLSPSCTVQYYACEVICTGCSNCTSDSAWSAHSTGYEKKVTRTCNCNTCSATTSYRCAAGYYGSSTNGTSGCTRCPDNGTSVAGTTSITGCCVSSGTDAAGTYSYSPQCCYQ
ncbi:MAG: hypothetical protein K2L94_02630 [Alphaproteobacteria bacterium]|nr:hypothetical protein [Alphaproteobacteria bacterium]